jgi:hypothetical protein
MEAERALGRVGFTFDLAEDAGAFLAATRAAGRSPQTLRSYRSALGRFLGWVGAARPGATCAELDHDLADGFLRHLRAAPATVRGRPLADSSVHLYVTVLKIFARWGPGGGDSGR